MSGLSSFSDQMDQRHSTQNLLSGGSELESQYQTESGLFITSFAGAIFIAAIVTIGVLFITVVTTLTVMLQSCQNSSHGVLELHETTDQQNYCRMFMLQAELNRLEVDEFPSICKAYAFEYIKGQYLRDLNWTMWIIKSFFNSVTPSPDGLDIVLLDIDDILIPIHHPIPVQDRFKLYQGSSQVENDKLQASVHIQELHSNLRASGRSVMFITRKPEKMKNETIENLISSGQGSWASLIMRSDDEMLVDSWEYFSRRREKLQNQGFHIRCVISSNMDALIGPVPGEHVFKLPTLSFYR